MPWPSWPSWPTWPSWSGRLVVCVQNLAVQCGGVLILERKIATCGKPGHAQNPMGKSCWWWFCDDTIIRNSMVSTDIWFCDDKIIQNAIYVLDCDHFDISHHWNGMKPLCLLSGSCQSPTPWAPQHTKANKITPQLQTSHLEGTSAGLWVHGNGSSWLFTPGEHQNRWDLYLFMGVNYPLKSIIGVIGGFDTHPSWMKVIDFLRSWHSVDLPPSPEPRSRVSRKPFLRVDHPGVTLWRENFEQLQSQFDIQNDSSLKTHPWKATQPAHKIDVTMRFQ